MNIHRKDQKGLTPSLSRGFTLIELLVVIAIIGILSSVVLASLNTARTKAREAAFQSEVRGVLPALVIACDDNAANADLIAAAGSGSTFSSSGVSVTDNSCPSDFTVTITPDDGAGGGCTSGTLNYAEATFAGC